MKISITITEEPDPIIDGYTGPRAVAVCEDCKSKLTTRLLYPVEIARQAWREYTNAALHALAEDLHDEHMHPCKEES